MTKALLKVVVAEDDSVQRTSLERLIQRLGFETIPAEDGIAALKLIKSGEAKILVTDFQMPNLNGIELVREIRQLDLGHYVHVIMITGSGEDDLRTAALDAGIDDWVVPAREAQRTSTATREENT